jgi:anhydro-N-acetylmuramic acid kinase
MSLLKAIGMMSGTSLDGVDVALIETDGEGAIRFGPTGYRAYSEEERRLLQDALKEAASLTERGQRPGVLQKAEALVTDTHAELAREFLRIHAIAPGDVAVAGFHGQTVLHQPQKRLTVQIGDGAALASKIGIAVAHDFRAADVAAGGQGAPLVPVFHRAIVQELGRPEPVAVLNLGGVANVTYVEAGRDPVACDVGPGNALIDDFMRTHADKPLDRDGEEGAKGTADEDFIAHILEHPFFAAPCPKSLDRNDFAFAALHLPTFSVPDGAATLTALTAAAVARVVPHLPKPPRTWIAAGGGAHNPTLVKMLAERLSPASVETAGAAGWSADALEAQAFAYLAVRVLKKLPITFPETTGAPHAMTGGLIAKA